MKSNLGVRLSRASGLFGGALVGLLVFACGASDRRGDDADASAAGGPAVGSSGVDGSAGPSNKDGATAEAGNPGACGDDVCTDWNEHASCAMSGAGAVWTRAKCPAGQGCVRGKCAAGGCSDACELGEAKCTLYDMTSGSGVAVDLTKTHDRARAFEKWIRTDTASLFHGQIVYASYKDSARTTVNGVYIGDSALHTGIYLAGEANRLLATGAPAARKNVHELVDLFHVLFGVSGDPAMMATSVFPAGDANLRTWTGWNCADFDRHCDVVYAGKHYDYVGQPSRDMYMGPLLGLVAAYDALGSFDEDRRELIRADVMTWAKEMVKKRMLPTRLVLNGVKGQVEQKEVRFFIPEKLDMVDGAVEIQINLSDKTNGQVRGGRDFMPNPALFFRKFAALSSLPDIPRSSSALMVGGIIQAALHVSEGVPSYAADRAALKAFHETNADEWGNANDWITVASPVGTTQHSCTTSYFGLGLAWTAAYTWGLLEQSPAIKKSLFANVIDNKMWPDASNQKQSLFAFELGAMEPAALTGTPRSDAMRQIQNFPAPPRVRVAKNGGCATDAAEIGDRAVAFLTWHTNPWNAQDTDRATQTYPGHDYLEAYWMGRNYGIVADDTPSRCLH